MKTQFTPGPWKVRKGLNPNNTDCWSVEIREDGWKEILCSHVGGCIDHTGGKRFQGSRQSNAALIAAAPEMFEALESAINWMVDPVITDWLNRSGVLGNYGTVVINARAALAKAKGEL